MEPSWNQLSTLYNVRSTYKSIIRTVEDVTFSLEVYVDKQEIIILQIINMNKK